MHPTIPLESAQNLNKSDLHREAKQERKVFSCMITKKTRDHQQERQGRYLKANGIRYFSFHMEENVTPESRGSTVNGLKGMDVEITACSAATKLKSSLPFTSED